MAFQRYSDAVFIPNIFGKATRHYSYGYCCRLFPSTAKAHKRPTAGLNLL